MIAILYIVSILCILGALAPLHHNRYWLIRTQSNIKVYYLFLSIILLVMHLLRSYLVLFDWVLIVFLLVCVIICVKAIWPYTFMGNKTVKNAPNDELAIDLNIITFNVLQFNTNYQKFIDLIRKENPDMFLTLEVNDQWYEAIKVLQEDYPFVVKDIRDNTYGIALMSRIPLDQAQVNYLVKDDIPSIDSYITVGGKSIRIFFVHPEPPIPGEVLTSMPKDLELLKIALDIRDNETPDYNILIGDLNDVGWSKNSLNFREISGLRDPREGRGFYSSFPTYLPIRIPIDQVFCSEDLSIVKFRRLKHIGSDHFPFHVVFAVPVG